MKKTCSGAAAHQGPDLSQINAKFPYRRGSRRSILCLVSTYPKRLRAKAEEIRGKAKTMADPEIRRHFDVVAAEYDRLARQVERATDRDKEVPAWRTRR